jgi:hypothetical protein
MVGHQFAMPKCNIGFFSEMRCVIVRHWSAMMNKFAVCKCLHNKKTFDLKQH